MVNSLSNSNTPTLEELRQLADAARQRREFAIQEKEQATVQKSSAEETKTAAETVKTSAELHLESVKATVIEAETLLASQKSSFDAVNSSYNTAITTLRTLKSANPVNTNAVDSQEAIVQNIYKNLQEVKKEVENAQKVLEERKADLTRAEEEAQKAQKDAEEAQNALQSAEEAVVDATDKLNAAEANLEMAENEVKEAELAEARAAEEAAASRAAELEDIEGVEETEFVPMSEEEAISTGYTVIKTVDDLLNIKNDLNGKYILMGNIDLDGINWTPIGDSKSPFKGEFNGNGFDISNLTINTDEADISNIGFFGVTENALISNVNIIDAQITTPNDFLTGSSSVGILVGTARGTSFDNITVSGDVTGFESVGGLAGTINDNSYVSKDGKIVSVNNSSINNVHTDVNVKSSYYAGGLVGYVEDTSTIECVATRFMTISNCSTAGTISVSEESAGGFIGEAGKTIITLENCTSSALLTWNNEEDDSDLSFLMETGRIGGFIGSADGT